MSKPRVCLYLPDGSPEWYDDCDIESSLIPDLSFTGTNDSGRRLKVVTSLAYKITRDAESHQAELQKACDALMAKVVPFRVISKESAIA